MTTQIAKSMMSPDIGGLEAGDLSWSARSSKVGWLPCQGQAVSRTVYAALFIAIGTAFGVGAHNNMQPFLAANLFIFARV